MDVENILTRDPVTITPHEFVQVQYEFRTLPFDSQDMNIQNRQSQLSRFLNVVFITHKYDQNWRNTLSSIIMN
jgi:hypothetical protein